MADVAPVEILTPDAWAAGVVKVVLNEQHGLKALGPGYVMTRNAIPQGNLGGPIEDYYKFEFVMVRSADNLPRSVQMEAVTRDKLTAHNMKLVGVEVRRLLQDWFLRQPFGTKSA